MPLPTQSWRALPPVSLAAGTIAGVLDGLYTSGQSNVYADGTARTPGTGSAWTWDRQQVTGITQACWGVPPTNTLNCGYIVAGSATAATPTMMSGLSEGFIQNALAISMNKNGVSPVTFPNGWTSSSPFGAGTFSGYVNGTTLTTGTLYLFECQEAFIIQILGGAGTSAVTGAGAFIDPFSSSAANAETDGRLYSLFTTGYNRVWQAGTWMQSYAATAYGPFKSGLIGTNSISRFMTFVPGSSTLNPNMLAVFNISLTSSYTAVGGEEPFITAPVATSSGTAITGPYMGELRGIYFTKAAITGNVMTDGANVKGYLFAPQTTSAVAPALILMY
jgi:hypothetical protein